MYIHHVCVLCITHCLFSWLIHPNTDRCHLVYFHSALVNHCCGQSNVMLMGKKFSRIKYTMYSRSAFFRDTCFFADNSAKAAHTETISMPITSTYNVAAGPSVLAPLVNAFCVQARWVFSQWRVQCRRDIVGDVNGAFYDAKSNW